VQNSHSLHPARAPPVELSPTIVHALFLPQGFVLAVNQGRGGPARSARYCQAPGWGYSAVFSRLFVVPPRRKLHFAFCSVIKKRAAFLLSVSGPRGRSRLHRCRWLSESKNEKDPHFWFSRIRRENVTFQKFSIGGPPARPGGEKSQAPHSAPFCGRRKSRTFFESTKRFRGGPANSGPITAIDLLGPLFVSPRWKLGPPKPPPWFGPPGKISAPLPARGPRRPVGELAGRHGS